MENELINFEFSNGAILRFLLYGAIIFAFFRLLHFLLPYVILRQDDQRIARRSLPFVEMVAWVLYLIWALQFFYLHSRLFVSGPALLLLILIFIVSWFALRDIIAGVIFKTGRSFRINQQISVGGFGGKIMALHLRTIELETETGEIVSLPYSRVLGQVIVKSHPAERILSHSFRIHLVRSKPLLESIEEIRRDILNMPWVSVKKTPRIRAVEETESEFVLEISVFSIEADYFFRIEKAIREKHDSRFVKS
ncbi:MAG: mechanosensitive ion channel family protein [Bacteroidetes bacterium]|nr:mechanosensitive ion channel family protein [Bacteroidota bacterium]MBU1719940.1 mechanosensitive ion channel family protein [Bacteroidota bacterium]